MKPYFTLFLLTLILLGCGGGGSSTPIDNPSPTHQEPLETNSTSLKQENEVKILPPISELNVTNDEKEDETKTLPLTSESNSTSDEKGSGALPSPKEFLDLVPLAYAPTGGGSIQLPASFDLSSQMPQVGDQGSQNSCVGWAVGYYLKSFHEHNEHQLPYGINSDYTHRYSPAFIYNIAKIDSCQSGATLFDALKLLKTTGTPPWEDMPYHQNDCTTTPSKVAIEKAMCGKISNFKRFNTQSVYFLSNLKYFLSRSYPIVVAIGLYDDFIYPQKHNNEYFFKELNAKESQASLSHALLVVGYDESRNAFKVINSWGVNWGNEGYLWIDYEVFKKIVIEAFVVEDEVEECEVGGNKVEEVIDYVTQSQRFIRDNITQIVTDKNTSLMWQDSEDVTTLRKVWEDAISYCQNLELGGYDDWYLPSLDELKSVETAPATYDNIFQHTNGGGIWTSTQSKNYSSGDGAWFAEAIFGYWDAFKSAEFFVRCTRNIDHKETVNPIDDNETLFPAMLKHAFVTRWDTTQPGATNSNQIKIGVAMFYIGRNYYSVDWGDGIKEDGFRDDAIHTYAQEGIYRVQITGTFSGLYFENDGEYDNNKLLTIEQWGDQQWISMYKFCMGCKNVNITAKDAPDLSHVYEMSRMFEGATSFNSDISHWDVSKVGMIDSMFRGATAFNQPIGKWNTSGVHYAMSAFGGATSFNQDLSHWDLQNATDLSLMFVSATSFNQDISNWNVNQVINMHNMFTEAKSFNQDLSNWDVSNVTDMSNMFLNSSLSTTNYNKLLEKWAQLDLQNNVSFGVGATKYTQAYTPFRESIIQSFNWTISDGGELLGEAITHNGLEYLTVQSSYTNRVWLDRNLGATKACQSINEALCFGDYYQWGRSSDGHEKEESLATGKLASTLEDLNSKFVVTTIEGLDDWVHSDDNGTQRGINWNKTDGSSLCPVGFKVPSEIEILNETLHRGIQNAQDAFDGFLKIPLAGIRYDATVSSKNTFGCLWTRTYLSDSSSIQMFLGYSTFESSYAYRTQGCSVRCIKEE